MEDEAAKRPRLDLDDDRRRSAHELTASWRATRPQPADEMARLRLQYLQRQLSALSARVRMLNGERLSFDDESKALYDAVAPTHPESHFQADPRPAREAVPGQRAARRAIRRVPPRVRDPAARSSTRYFSARSRRAASARVQHITLPDGEQFTVEYVTNKSWSGYNWYQGGFRSLIQVNTDLPIYIDRAIDLACHEGYPGHHVYNVLLEKNLVKDRGWKEFTVYPLFSPQSLIAEGTANFGIEVAFPGKDRVEFERTVLFPAAGLDPARAAEYYEVQGLVDQLAYAGNEAARRYINRRDRRGAGGGVARALRADAARPRRAARAVLRSVPKLRDQLQPREGHGAPLHRIAWRHGGQSRRSDGRNSSGCSRRRACPPA